MSDRPTRVISADALRDLMERMLGAVGCERDIAQAVANVHLEADLRGYQFQGIDHMFDLIIQVQDGNIDPNGRPEIVKEGAAWAHISGNRGPGHLAAILGAETAIRKATNAGSCAVGITNSADLYMLGYYGEMIARGGCAAFLSTGCPPLVHAFGGTEPVVGTNPLVIAIPTADDHPILLDMSTSIRSASYFRQAAYHQEQVPEGFGVGPDGEPSTDAATIDRADGEGGAIAPMAGHKGFGLGLCLSILSGPMVGAATGKGLEGWTDEGAPVGPMGHFFFAVNPAVYGDPAVFKDAVGVHLAEIKQSRRAPDVSEIRIPGERAFSQREKSLRDGVFLQERIWDRARELSAELGVEMPE